MNRTTIEWTDFTWNPVTGCHKVSPGCKNCYAETITNRFAKTWGVKSFRDVVLHEDRLSEPTKNKKKWAGKKVFVCSMSDLFQELVNDHFIWRVFQQMHFMPDTTFQILTKRLERAALFLKDWIPAPNVWIGSSVENQETANERIPLLLQIPAAVRFLSCEPLLEPIDLGYYLRYGQSATANDLPQLKKIHWVIAGGESGHNARPMHPDWVRSLRDQCAAANVPFLFKQWGEWAPTDGNGPNEFAICSTGSECTGCNDREGFHFMKKVGKSKSGNLLDGKQHLEFPVPEITIHIDLGFTETKPPIELGK